MQQSQLLNSGVVHKIKILIVGQSGVGKTSIANRFCRDLFEYTSTSTIGIQLANRQFVAPIIKNQSKCMISIWDIAGIDNQMFQNPLIFRNALGVIYVYDVTKQETLEALQDWYKLIYNNTNSRFLSSILIGNKTDLKHFREIELQTAKKWARQKKISQRYVFQTSALENSRVQTAICELISNIIYNLNNKKDKIILNPALLAQKTHHRGCC